MEIYMGKERLEKYMELIAKRFMAYKKQDTTALQHNNSFMDNKKNIITVNSFLFRKIFQLLKSEYQPRYRVAKKDNIAVDPHNTIDNVGYFFEQAIQQALQTEYVDRIYPYFVKFCQQTVLSHKVIEVHKIIIEDFDAQYEAALNDYYQVESYFYLIEKYLSTYDNHYQLTNPDGTYIYSNYIEGNAETIKKINLLLPTLNYHNVVIKEDFIRTTTEKISERMYNYAHNILK